MIVALFVIIVLQLGREDNPPPKGEKTYTSPKPDPNRRVHHFDWANDKFVYEDEIKPDSGKYTEHSPYPEMWTKDMNRTIQDHARRRELGHPLTYDHIITVEGKRYRIWQKENGEKTLIPLRTRN